MASRIHHRLKRASDLASLSDELQASARGWAETRELAKSAPNALRALELLPTHRALLVTDGHGALARYLAEACASVDVHGTGDRVRDIAARVRDLSNVQVREQTEFTSDGYDVVVINKTLTRPGIGPGGAAVPLLEEMAKALRPGGSIVWLVGNGLSVRKLVGAQTPTADQMTRVRLERALEALGFEVDVLSLFPSTLNARVLIADSLFERPEASLTWRLPRFPRTVEGQSTRGLWRTLSEEGVGPHFAPGLLALARDRGGGHPDPLWKAENEAVFFTSERHAEFMTKTIVRRAGPGLRFERERLAGPEREVRRGSLILRVENADFVPGMDFFERLVGENEDWLRTALGKWRELVELEAQQIPRDIDLIPRNLVVNPSGELESIDRELYHTEYTITDILARGIVDLVAELSPRSSWPIAGDRRRDIAMGLGEWAGLEGEGWLDEAVRREAELRSLLKGQDADPGRWRVAVRQYEREFTDLLRTRTTPRNGPGLLAGVSQALRLVKRMLSRFR